MLFALLLAAQPAPADVFGTWQTETPEAVVTVADCGDGTPCGTLRLSGPEADLLDENNPDEALRARPVDGLTMLWGFQRRGDAWKRGRIYDPEAGKTYRSAVERTDEDTLAVKGCVGPICLTQRWTRVPAAADSPAR